MLYFFSFSSLFLSFSFFLLLLLCYSIFPPKSASTSPPWKLMRSTWNSKTVARIISVRGRLLLSAIWPTLLRFPVIKLFLALAFDTLSQQAIYSLSMQRLTSWYNHSYTFAALRAMTCGFLEREFPHLQRRHAVLPFVCSFYFAWLFNAAWMRDASIGWWNSV